MLDSPTELKRKVNILARWMRASNHTVAHTGAGVSTSAGIPDFRWIYPTTRLSWTEGFPDFSRKYCSGPKGVWTLEAEGKMPNLSVTFDDAIPTFTHLSLVTLEKHGILKYIVHIPTYVSKFIKKTSKLWKFTQIPSVPKRRRAALAQRFPARPHVRVARQHVCRAVCDVQPGTGEHERVELRGAKADRPEVHASAFQRPYVQV